MGFANNCISKFQKKVLQTRIESFLGHSRPLLGPTTQHLSRERKFLFRRFFGHVPQNSSKYPPAEQQFYGEIRVLIGDVAIVLL